MTVSGLLRRLPGRDAAPVPFRLDGEPVEGRAGDTLLTAILTLRASLRDADLSGAPRAGFCQMGACQDCWVELDDGARLRACSTPLRAGMSVLTRRRDVG